MRCIHSSTPYLLNIQDGWIVSPTQWTWVWWTLGAGDGQGGLACCSSWGCKELDTTERLNWTIHNPWNSPGQNTGVGSRSLLQGIFPTQGSNLGLPHCRQIFYPMNHQGSPKILESLNTKGRNEKYKYLSATWGYEDKHLEKQQHTWGLPWKASTSSWERTATCRIQQHALSAQVWGNVALKTSEREVCMLDG